jgi:V/A-type H+-transporting ATPase subunit C
LKGSGGVSAYAAINAKVRVKYASLLTSEDFSRLEEAADFSSLVSQLKPTVIGPYLGHVNDRDLTPRRAVFQIRNWLADDYVSILRMAPEHTRPLIRQFYRYFEVDNLKAVLRGILAGTSWDRVRFVLFPQGSLSNLPLQEMVDAGNVIAAVELLRNTQYYDPLSFALRRFNTEQNLFPLEVALDLHYWRDLWKFTHDLSGEDKNHALKIIGLMVDMNNLMWAIRYRVYHQISEEELINYTLSFGYHVQDEDIRAIAAGADILQIVKRIFPDFLNLESILQEPWNRLPELELQLKRQLVKQCQTAFLGNPFHIGLPISYLELSDLQIQDLTVLIEAKSMKIPAEGYQHYLIIKEAVK